MIGMLHGRVESVDMSSALIEVGGVGYETRMPSADLASMHAGQEVKVYTSLNVSQDAITLFGFLTPASKRMFLQLQKVSGIGPKVALSLLSTRPRIVWPMPSPTAMPPRLPRRRDSARKAHRRLFSSLRVPSISARSRRRRPLSVGRRTLVPNRWSRG